MWDEIEARKRRLDALRPLAPRGLAAIEAWYDVELTYSSNAVEGNTLTRQEIAIVLEKGLTVRGKPLKDHLEAIDHRDALAYVRLLARAGRAWHHDLFSAYLSRYAAGRVTRGKNQ